MGEEGGGGFKLSARFVGGAPGACPLGEYLDFDTLRYQEMDLKLTNCFWPQRF